MKRRGGYEIDGARLGQARQTLNHEGHSRSDDEPAMTQERLAELVEIHRTTLTKVETGAARVSLDLLERLAAVTGRSREWLLGEPEETDAFELARERMANAMSKIADGFEDFQTAVKQLEDRARQAAVTEEIEA